VLPESDCRTGLERNVLIHQIESQAYQCHQIPNKQHNFPKALPVHLADEGMKDVYMLDHSCSHAPAWECIRYYVIWIPMGDSGNQKNFETKMVFGVV